MKDKASGRTGEPFAEVLRLLVIWLGSFGALWPLLDKGLQGGTHDAGNHLYRLLDFDLTFRSGELLPRLAPHLALDYGYATFAFYSPLVLYLGEAFRLLGLGYIASLKAEFALAILLGGLGAYLLARDLYGWPGALVAGLVYANLPYLLLDIYTRGDLSEALALGLLPVVFWAFRRVAVRPTIGHAAAAGTSGGALVLTHNLSALLAAPVLLAFLVVVALERYPVRSKAAGRLLRRAILGVAGSGLFALALSAWYWPQLLGRLGTLDGAALTTGYFDYHHWFTPPTELIQSRWAYDYRFALELGARFNLGRTQAILLVAATLWVLLARPRGRAVLLLGAGVVAVCLWLQQAGASFVWDAVPVSRFIQFPYRLSGLIGLMSALLIGGFWAPREDAPVNGLLALENTVLALKGQGRRPRGCPGLKPAGNSGFSRLSLPWPGRGVPSGPGRARTPSTNATTGKVNLRAATGLVLGGVALVAFVGASLAHLPGGHVSVQESELNLPTLWELENDRGLIAASTRGDYLPRWITGDFFQVLAAREPVPVGTSPVRLTARGPQGSLSFDTTTESAAPARIVLDRLSDPAWTATLDGRPITLLRSGRLGLIALDLPAGTHELRLAAGETLPAAAGDSVAALALQALAFVVVRPRSPGWPRRGGLLLMGIGVAAIAVAAAIRRPEALAGGIDFGEVRLVGSQLDRSAAEPPGALDVDLVWQARRAPLPDCTVHLWLVDEQGRVVARRDKPPLFGFRPCSDWQSGEVVRDREEIRLPPEAPAGRYRLVLALSLGNALAAPGPDAALWRDPASGERGAVLGMVDAPAAPAAATLPSARSLPAGAASLGDTFALDAARVADATRPVAMSPTDDPRFLARIAPGDRLSVDLLWRALRDTPLDYSVSVQLLDPRQKLVAQSDDWPDRANFPTAVWFPGDTLADQHDLETRPDLAPGVYRLVAGMYRRDTMARLPAKGEATDRDQIILGQIKVVGPHQVFGKPRAVDPVNRTLGGEIALAGARVESGNSSAAVVDLEWRAVARPATNETVFVHLLDPSGKLVAQRDGPPLGGAYPTLDWDPADVVYDQITVPLPANLASATYRVEVGMYDPVSGARLPDARGVDSFVVGTVEVKARDADVP